MSQAANCSIVLCPDPDTLAARAAEHIREASVRAIAARGRFTLALAGGSTPEKAYRLLAQPQRAGSIDWSKTHLFFGDERFVPHDDPRSNYGMARRALLRSAPIPAQQVFPIPTDLATPQESAAAYARVLATFFGVEPGKDVPRFDLILLGMGDDGHTASLFPGKPALREQSAWVVATPPGVLPPPVDRVTLTFPVLNTAREVLFLVTGEKKAAPLRDVLEGAADVTVHPAAGVRPREGTLTWLVDEAAAQLLSRKG
jgi:6-phosphogluconolactonase